MSKRKLHLLCPANLKAVGNDEDGTFEGYGSIFGNMDAYGDIVVKGAFARDIAEGKKPALLWQHRSDMPCGIYMEIREDEKGLYLKGQLNLETQVGKEAYALLKQGALSGLSIGFNTRKSEWDEVNKIRRLVDVELWEVSLVTFPANSAARVEGVKSEGEGDDGEEMPDPVAMVEEAMSQVQALAEGGEATEEALQEISDTLAEAHEALVGEAEDDAVKGRLPRSVRQFERALRDAGLPKSWARKAASAAWPTLAEAQRDVAASGEGAATADQQELAAGMKSLLANIQTK